MSLLSVKEISKKVNDDLSLDGISFTQNEFENIAIVGETGAGKSTLLKMIAGFEQPDSGEVLLAGKKLKGPNYQLVPGHEGVAYLSQYFELRNWYRVEELLDMASHLADNEAERIYQLCQIEHLVKRRTDQLSGGEKQRIALARLLVTKPRLLILDEPFSNTDMIHKRVLKAVVQDVAKELRITCIMTAHDPLDILPWADKLLVMRDGRVIQEGTPHQVYEEPQDEYVAGLLGNYNIIPVMLARKLGMSEKAKEQTDIIIRPEKLVTTPSGEGLSGVVEDVRYMGSYDEILVNVDDVSLMIFSHDDLKKGDNINIRMK